MNSPKLLIEFTDEELLQEEKKRKESAQYNPLFIGILAGIIVWSVVKNGFGFLPIPLLGAILYLGRAGKKFKEVKTEIEARRQKN